MDTIHQRIFFNASRILPFFRFLELIATIFYNFADLHGFGGPQFKNRCFRSLKVLASGRLSAGEAEELEFGR